MSHFFINLIANIYIGDRQLMSIEDILSVNCEVDH